MIEDLNPMRACIQRVREARVETDSQIIGRIGEGLVVLLGIAEGDGEGEVRWLADKIVTLRIFSDTEGKMNRSLLDIQGEMLVVSQFTLLGDCRKGRRPSFIAAARPEQAERLYSQFCQRVQGQGVQVATGQFAADMQVMLVNDGPVTLLVETPASSVLPNSSYGDPGTTGG
jgi:D-tyrosyl-tRNA(Tyr) deacylase